MVSMLLFGVMLATVVNVGGEFNTVMVLAIESTSEFVSVTVPVHRISSIGETVAVLRVRVGLLPRLLRVVMLYHSYDQETLPPSGSEPVPVQVSVAEVVGALGEILRLVAMGGVFSMVADALPVPVSELASVAVTRQMICSPGSNAE